MRSMALAIKTSKDLKYTNTCIILIFCVAVKFVCVVLQDTEFLKGLRTASAKSDW